MVNMFNATLLFLSVGALIVLFFWSLARGADGADRDWKLARLEQKIDLILTHMGLGHDAHVPESVVGLARAGRKIEAIKEYRKLTGASLVVAKREVEFLLSRDADPKDAPRDEL